MKKLAIVLVITAVIIFGGWYGTFSLRRTKANAYFELGNKYFQEQNDRQSIIEYKKAAFLYPGAETYFALGQVYFLNQNASRAENYFKNALKKDEKHAKAIFGLAETYLYQEKYDEARGIFEDKKIDDPLIKIGLARIYLAQEKDEKASEKLKNQTDEFSKFYQAKILLYQEQYQEVERKLLAIEAKENLQRTMLPLEPTSSFLKIINDAANQSLKTANDTTRKVIFGESLNQTGDAVIALPILKKITQENSTYRDAYVFLGHSYILIKKYETAKEIFLKAIDLDPVYFPSWLYLGEAYEGLDNMDAANKCYDKAEKLQ